ADAADETRRHPRLGARWNDILERRAAGRGSEVSIAGFVLGQYEPLSGTIRLPYDFPAGRNVFEDPYIAHEFVHHGQAVLTVLGADYLMMLHELMIATMHLCRSTHTLPLPLSDAPPELRRHPAWDY